VRVRCEEGSVGLDEDPLRLRNGQGFAQIRGVLERQCPGEGHVPALRVAGPGQFLAPRKAVEDNPLGGALLTQDLHHVVVGVPVVDLQGQPQPLGNIDVAAEGIPLVGQPLPLGPEKIQPRLADCADPRVRGQGLDLGQGVLQLPPPGVIRRIIGVDRDGAQQPGVQLDGPDREPGGLQVAPHLHGTLDAHRSGRVEGVADADREFSLGEVQVRVVVHHRHGKGLGRRRIPTASGAVAAGRAKRDGSKGGAHLPTLTWCADRGAPAGDRRTAEI
jgi:hypothetical protein